MRKEDYVSFEVAKMLKDKGFDYPCYIYYTTDGEMESTKVQMNHNFGSDISCPNFYEVQSWLREEHMMYITIKGDYLFYDVGNGELRDEERYFEFVIYEDTIGSFDERITSKYQYKTYEKALEAAIIESLKTILV